MNSSSDLPETAAKQFNCEHVALFLLHNSCLHNSCLAHKKHAMSLIFL